MERKLAQMLITVYGSPTKYKSLLSYSIVEPETESLFKMLLIGLIIRDKHLQMQLFTHFLSLASCFLVTLCFCDGLFYALLQPKEKCPSINDMGRGVAKSF